MEEVSIWLGEEQVTLLGSLTIPKNAKIVVIFAHGSGSGRFSPRNQFVARYLNKEGIATLLMDLLTREEEVIDEVTRELRFDIPLLARRLTGVSLWLEHHREAHPLKIAYFGASTGAAAALISAAQDESEVVSVVSRGGRPDLAASVLSQVKAPTLLIVGGNDLEVINLNMKAFDLLTGTKKMEIVPGATHLFEEPGTLEEVARLAASWFKGS